MGIFRQSIIASIYLLVTPVSSNLKMVDDRSVGIKGELDSKVKWESREENVTVLVLMELSHGLILGADWIKNIGGISIYPSTSTKRVIPNSTPNPSKKLIIIQSGILPSGIELIKKAQWPISNDNGVEKL
jgi:hypothetical protein